ncbi:hypothetical protein N7481_007541 [Penicillium waksmanii]|uniref:uncharacterized protein n=1 Tax=Penicillium waksmanii TaxID=69791 RepID=UPI002548AD7D|nr:uncharacterized protein N7481_007541 [Penicillium waksmanii]KAJ5980243.1 hypothetical protein N7481_007541 [Penicillium waksmanii]
MVLHDVYYHKAIATFLRALVRPRLHLNPKPNEEIFIPSRDAGRTIKVHLYQSANATNPTPVLINFCGSGSVLPTYGNDDEFCRFVANETRYSVLDVQYRLAPENPFPAAFHDAEDVVNWARSQPDRFDASELSLSGFSSGGNIALGLSSASSQFCQEGQPSIFHTVISLYGPTNMALPTPEKPQVDTSNWIMRKIFPGFSHLCHKCSIPDGVDPKDPRLSPKFGNLHNFPNNVLTITAAQCSFALEAEELAQRLGSIDGKYSVYKRMDGCAHGWDKEAIRGTSQCVAKDEAYALAASMLEGNLKRDFPAGDLSKKDY